MKPNDLENLEVGDKVERVLGGSVVMPLVVTAVTETIIRCGAWEFSRRNGAEIDEDMGWTEEQSGSIIRPA